jgi:hypothetical protein
MEGYETIILVGIMMLIVWYDSLPYDNVLFDVWDNVTKQVQRHNHDFQNPLHATRTIVEQVDNHFNIGYIMEGIAKIVVYVVVPVTILYKMFIIVKRELRFNPL